VPQRALQSHTTSLTFDLTSDQEKTPKKKKVTGDTLRDLYLKADVE